MSIREEGKVRVPGKVRGIDDSKLIETRDTMQLHGKAHKVSLQPVRISKSSRPKLSADVFRKESNVEVKEDKVVEMFGFVFMIDALVYFMVFVVCFVWPTSVVERFELEVSRGSLMLCRLIGMYSIGISMIVYYATVMDPGEAVKMARCMFVFCLSMGVFVGSYVIDGGSMHTEVLVSLAYFMGLTALYGFSMFRFHRKGKSKRD